MDTQAHTYDRSRSGTPNPDSRIATPTAQKFPTLPDADALLSMSLSSKPIITARPHPVFGLPSLQNSSSRPGILALPPKPNHNEDEMDWIPTNPDPSEPQEEKSETSYSWLRPQRFFAPEKPTGLEGLFENTRIQDEPMPLQPLSSRKVDQELWNYLWEWRLSFTLFFAIFAVLIGCTLKWLGVINWAL